MALALLVPGLVLVLLDHDLRALGVVDDLGRHRHLGQRVGVGGDRVAVDQESAGISNDEPGSPGTRSSSNTSPTATFSCLPPLRTIAYTATLTLSGACWCSLTDPAARARDCPTWGGHAGVGASETHRLTSVRIARPARSNSNCRPGVRPGCRHRGRLDRGSSRWSCARSIARRRMVRRYDPDRPVPAEVRERLLEHALHAPSAGFSQGWAFLVLEEPADRELFWAATTGAGAADTWLDGHADRAAAGRRALAQGRLPRPVRRAGQGLDRPRRGAVAGARTGTSTPAWRRCSCC